MVTGHLTTLHEPVACIRVTFVLQGGLRCRVSPRTIVRDLGRRVSLSLRIVIL